MINMTIFILLGDNTMKTDYFADPYTQTMIQNMPEKTGKSLEAWFKAIAEKKLSKHSDIMTFIKGDHGVTHGYANTISLLYRQMTEGGPPSEASLIKDQYAKKLDLKPIYDYLVTEVECFGPDLEISPKKSYVSLRRARQFPIIQPSTKTRIDLGLNLDADVDASGCLIKGDKWSGMCSHRIELYNMDDITPEVMGWLKQAYLSAG
jgi:predicted transport protein